MASSNSDQSRLLKPIRGSHGLPFFGAFKDRLDYFYNQGQDEFFLSRIKQHGSTVFRTNMPPGPFIASDPRVIAVLDAVSFPILFDTSKVEKRNVLDGTFMPSTSFTGGHRVCAYLDPSEPNHAALKGYFLSILASKHDTFIPLFRACLSELFANIEDHINDNKTANFNALRDDMSFNFVFSLFCDRKPADCGLGFKGHAHFDKWLFCQLHPLMSLGISKFLNLFEDCLLHMFPLPSLLVKSAYYKLYDAFYSSAAPLLDEAERRFGIKREEACHNLVFLAGFNAYGGMKAWFPTLIKWVGSGGESLHRQLADEIRTVVKEEGGVTITALEKMSLTKSVIYEALRNQASGSVPVR